MSHLLLDVVDGVGFITLNRPEARNAASPAMVDGLLDGTARFESDSAVRCLVIRAAGDHFMAGGDVKGFHAGLVGDREAHVAGFEQRILRGHQIFNRLRRMPKPVLVATQGAVAGLGISILMASDLAIAADDAFYTLAYRHVGLSMDGCVSYTLPRVIGERKALELALLGERFDAAEALGLGMVNRVVPAADLAAETDRLARRLADGPTLALAAMKKLIRGSMESSFDEQSHREAETIAAMVVTEDHLEGVTAFVEKRRTTFRGR